MKKKLTKIEKQLSDNFQTKQKKEHNSENFNQSFVIQNNNSDPRISYLIHSPRPVFSRL